VNTTCLSDNWRNDPRQWPHRFAKPTEDAQTAARTVSVGFNQDLTVPKVRCLEIAGRMSARSRSPKFAQSTSWLGRCHGCLQNVARIFCFWHHLGFVILVESAPVCVRAGCKDEHKRVVSLVTRRECYMAIQMYEVCTTFSASGSSGRWAS